MEAMSAKKLSLRSYRQLVLDIFDAGGRPRRILDRKFLILVANLAFEQDFIIVSDGDVYVLGFDFGVTPQDRFDLLFDVLGPRMRLYFDVVDNAAHPLTALGYRAQRCSFDSTS
jgi:hypothetical protein